MSDKETYESGLLRGQEIGQSIGEMAVGEYAWHSVGAALDALIQNDELRAIILLKTLRIALSQATGHEAPGFLGGKSSAVTRIGGEK